MKKGISVQPQLPGIGKPGAQTEMFAEFSGKYARKDKLIDVETWQRQQSNKPIDGQQNLL